LNSIIGRVVVLAGNMGFRDLGQISWKTSFALPGLCRLFDVYPGVETPGYFLIVPAGLAEGSSTSSVIGERLMSSD
jgi:hypothetical protein